MKPEIGEVAIAFFGQEVATDAGLGVEIKSQALILNIEIGIDQTDPGFQIRMEPARFIRNVVLGQHVGGGHQSFIVMVVSEPKACFHLEIKWFRCRVWPDSIVIVLQDPGYLQKAEGWRRIITMAEGHSDAGTFRIVKSSFAGQH